MLRTMLYKGLRQDVEYISGHLCLSIIDFDELRVEIQKIKLNIQFRADLCQNLQ